MTRLPGSHHPLDGEQRGDVAEGHMGRDQHDPQLGSRSASIMATSTSAGEVGQPLGVTGKGKAREMQRMLVGGSGDDGVHFAGERELAAASTAWPAMRPARMRAVSSRVAAALAPGAHRHLPVSRYAGDLVLGADEGDLGVERVGQRARR